MDQGLYVDAMRTNAKLVGCAVREEVPDASMLDGLDARALLAAAACHSLSSTVAFALQSAGINTQQVQQEAARGVWRATQMEMDWQLVRAGLDARGIWYCPLKGAVLKDLYPAIGMRQMADYDILFDSSRSDDVRSVMEGAGFTTEHYGQGNHDVYYKLPVSNFEMHRRLFGPGQDSAFVSYFVNVKDRLIKDEEDGCGWRMDVNECYLYLLAHEYKHYASAGTGLRSPLDIYVYLRRCAGEMDWDEVHAKTRRLGIADFEVWQRGFVRRLFEGEELSPEDEELFVDLVVSGTYGTMSRRISRRLKENGGNTRAKLAYLADRLVPSAESLRGAYPFFCRHKVLLPALYVFRLGRAVTVRHRAVARELACVWRFGREARDH